MGDKGSPSSDEGSFEDCVEALEVGEEFGENEKDIEKLTGAVKELEIAKDFSLENLHVYFQKSFEITEEIDIEHYILGFREVYKFLTLLGSVFSFVAVDVQTKIDVLHKYNTGENKDKYQTLKTMIQYEVENDMILKKKRDDPSGSRTLLRLHRALDYVCLFLGKLDGITHDDKCSSISREAYESTLQKHHIWAIQKAAKLAMALLPTKGGLVLKVCPEAASDESLMKKVEADFIAAVNSMKKVFETSQALYESHELLNIP